MQLNPLFSDGAVFQAGRPIRLFGTGDGTAAATLDGDSARAESCDGLWRLELPARPHGGPYDLEIDLGGKKRVLRDVHVGETLLMAGQSNMQFKLRESKTDTAVFADNPLVRLFTTRRPEAGDRFRPEDGWVRCARADAPDWPAIPYFTANFLQERLGCAVGVAVAYQGASTIQSWLPVEACDDASLDVPDAFKHPDHFAPAYSWNRTGILFDAVFRQLAPFSFGRVIWYQGESNTREAEGAVYDRHLARLADVWRQALESPSLPFDIVQIADFTPRDDAGWRSVQEAQERAAARIPHANLVRCADICERDEIHPPTKSRLGARLADMAAAAARSARRRG